MASSLAFWCQVVAPRRPSADCPTPCWSLADQSPEPDTSPELSVSTQDSLGLENKAEMIVGPQG